MPADHIGIDGDEVTFTQSLYGFSDSNHMAGIFVSRRDRIIGTWKAMA